MQIVVADSETDFYEKAALRIAQEIRKNPAAKIGLSTGRTTKGVHAALAGMYQESPFDCSGVTVFGIDEITNMSRDCRASCYYILLHEVVELVGDGEAKGATVEIGNGVKAKINATNNGKIKITRTKAERSAYEE